MADENARRQLLKSIFALGFDILVYASKRWEIALPGSGQLGLKMAKTLGVPHGTVATVIKALRAGRMLAMKGRGVSAAQMTADDAIAITVGIMSAAVTAEVPAVTKLLLAMPLRHFVRAAPKGQAVELSEPDPHTFLEGCRALFEGDEWDEAAGSSGDRRETVGQKDGVWVTAAVDGRREKGFGLIEARGINGDTWQNFYSTMELWAAPEASSSPGAVGLSLYRDAPTFVFSSIIDGRAVAAVKLALSEPLARRGSRRTLEISDEL